MYQFNSQFQMDFEQENFKAQPQNNEIKIKDNRKIGLEEGNDSEGEEEKPSESQFIALSPFQDLYPNSSIVKFMKEFGQNIVPLTMVGMLMNYAGNHLLHYIFQQYNQRVFHPGHQVISIQLLDNG